MCHRSPTRELAGVTALEQTVLTTFSERVSCERVQKIATQFSFPLFIGKVIRKSLVDLPQSLGAERYFTS